MDIYTLNLTLLLTLCLALFLFQRKHKPLPPPDPITTPTTTATTTTTSHDNTTTPRTKPNPPTETKTNPPTAPTPTPKDQNKKKKKSTTPFLLAYTLATASDWLQGAHLSPLYRDTHKVPPTLVPLLFMTGFLASAVSGYFVGRWADLCGRRRACLGFCAVYFGACLLTAGVIPGLEGGGLGLGSLVLGRVLGGVGTGLLFVGFESWVVGYLRGGDGDGDGDGDGGEELGRVFGVMSGLNSVAAVVCGVGSEWYVEPGCFALRC